MAEMASTLKHVESHQL